MESLAHIPHLSAYHAANTGASLVDTIREYLVVNACDARECMLQCLEAVCAKRARVQFGTGAFVVQSTARSHKCPTDLLVYFSRKPVHTIVVCAPGDDYSARWAATPTVARGATVFVFVDVPAEFPGNGISLATLFKDAHLVRV